MSEVRDQEIGSLFLHGTLAESIPGIKAEGIKCSAGDPCFTKNLILACCRYAHRGYNSNHIYSGKIFIDAQTLEQQGLVRPQESRERLLEETGKYWDENDNTSAVFVVLPGDLVPGPAAVARLAIDHQKRLVSGGITKWIEGHTALHTDNDRRYRNKQKFLRGGLAAPTQEGTSGQRSATAPCKGIIGAPRIPVIFSSIPSTPELRGMLRQYGDVIAGHKDDVAIAGQLTQYLRSHLVPLEGNKSLQEGWDVEQVVAKIMEQTIVATQLTEIRRGFLSILRSQGYTIYKTDHNPPYVEVSEVFWPEEHIGRNIENLFASIQRLGRVPPKDPGMKVGVNLVFTRDIRTACKGLESYIRMLERLRQESYPVDFPGYIYKELDKSTWFYD